jgi:hypothetical protein
MEILQFLLSFLLKEGASGYLEPLFENLKNNNFDLIKTLQGLNLQTIAPLIRAFMENYQKNENRPTKTAERNISLAPIAGFADKDIVYALNKYISVVN